HVCTTAQSCPPPSVPENSLMTGSNFTYGSKVTFRYPLTPYHFPAPNKTRECLSSGQWSDSSAQCVPRSCGPPPAIDHAEPYESHQLFGDTANYFCTDGYTAGNNSKMVCNAEGVWAPPDGEEPPRCIANFCLRPPQLPHAILDSLGKPKYTSDSEVSYKCEEGFVLNTTATLRCLLGGEWDPRPFDISCMPVRCSKPDGIDRGYVSGSDYNFGAVVAYSCDKGFLIRGEKRRTCKANGEWGGVLPTCVPVDSPSTARPTASGPTTIRPPATSATRATSSWVMPSGPASSTAAGTRRGVRAARPCSVRSRSWRRTTWF
uniref:Sushi domain-containing protein n=1 Tax=Hippocampus comes TaxID=109280 RepID=A0A3Q2XUN9_HIPCM